LTDTAVQSFYRYHSYIYDSTRWMILHGRRRAVDRLQLRRDSNVLEVGCGTGLNFRFVLERLDPQRGRLTGLDFSADMLHIAERRVKSRGWHNVELVQADASQMGLGRTFDGVLFSYSLTMIPDWRGALDRAAEHLEPGGRVVVLDFYTFRGWGPLAPVMRTWLKLNHVETRGAYVEAMRERFGNVDEYYWLGGYNFTAVSRKP
jgi:S-adenosylmethionine-diacylgycerolhomoserine-N-methlytransferase